MCRRRSRIPGFLRCSEVHPRRLPFAYFVPNTEETGAEERLLYRPIVQTQIACADKEVSMNAKPQLRHAIQVQKS